MQWDYDDTYRLTSEKRLDNTNSVTSQAAWTYDPVGNRLSQTVNGTTTNYTYNALDQVVTAGAAQYHYDGRGNVKTITDGENGTNYRFDSKDQMRCATLPNDPHRPYGYEPYRP